MSRAAAAVRAVLLLAVVLCCPPGASASTDGPSAAANPGVPAVSPARTPAHPAENFEVRAYAPAGLGSSCHGSFGHTAAALLPALSAPAALPHPDGVSPAAPRPGAASIRGPSHDAVQAVDRLRLQVQRI